MILKVSQNAKPFLFREDYTSLLQKYFYPTLWVEGLTCPIVKRVCSGSLSY